MRILALIRYLPVLLLLTALLQLDAIGREHDRRLFGKGHPFAVADLPDGKLKKNLGKLPAESRARALRWLHSMTFESFDAAEHLRVDAAGGVYTVCPESHSGCRESADKKPCKDGCVPTKYVRQASAAVPISSPPAYNSKPGAPFHIYLDFNGAYVTDKAWTETDGTTTWDTWDCYAYDTDGDDTTFDDGEQEDIRRIWERVAEDYSPFNVNVTTDVTYDSDNYTGDKNKVGWLLITGNTDKNGARCPHYGAGGVAYVGVFGGVSYFSMHQPAWVLATDVEGIAHASSHEMGHNMGMNHDGTSSATYYSGHTATANAPSWGPLMGTGPARNVTQWSKGDYYDANRTAQDDLAIIDSKISYRQDDHGDTFGSATIWSDAEVTQEGIVERTGNPDYFTFSTASGVISFNASAYRCDSGTWGSNLDIRLELYDSSQNLIATDNPAEDVSASITQTVTAGDYYLVLKPVAAGTPLNNPPDGYSLYGSLGQYRITGNFVPSDDLILLTPNGSETWYTGQAQTIRWASGLGGNVRIELLKNESLNTTIASSTANDGAFDWTIAANQSLGADFRIRVTSLVNPSKSDTSFGEFSIALPPIYYADMDSDPGWSLDAGWEFGKPIGGGGAHGNPDPISGFDGPNVIGYNLNGDYEANITPTRWATTPVFDCSNHENITLSFQRWLGVEGAFDNAYIQISTNGIDWTNIWENSKVNGVDDTDSSWTLCEYDISAIADGQPAVQIRWGIKSDGIWHFCGWNIDEVLVDGDYVSGSIADVSLPAGISLYGYTGADAIDAKTAFQPLIDSGKLVLVRWINPAGSIKELYYSTFPSPGWINEIGDMTLGEGYVVKTTGVCTLSIAGSKATSSVVHDLPAGYTIIGFNQEAPLDARSAFQPLIDANKLELVRWVDPSTGNIKELYYSTFPAPGWVNEIGDLTEGQGYIIKLNAPHNGFSLP